ncbi:hypothetical protein H312_00632 [Anncaliia algerae PRA339]|uniref:Uncharacterized protein n=1 Tax=Anncaliia algerae PRA339 TaxID=1288291 RepID=A0A059F3K6_9MICR|nr:hypothetical protein H312_00632 [Anncaliia algerae PRA339]
MSDISINTELNKILENPKKEIIEKIKTEYNNLLHNLDEKYLNMTYLNFQYLINENYKNKYLPELTKDNKSMRVGSLAYQTLLNQSNIFKENSPKTEDYDYLRGSFYSKNKKKLTNKIESIHESSKINIKENKNNKSVNLTKEDETCSLRNTSLITESLTINFMDKNYALERVGNTKRIKEFTEEVKKLIKKYIK